MLPNFICPGAQKSATTTLYDLLRQHPDVYLPDVKELHFFDNEEKFLKSISFYEKEFFSEVKGEKVIGDITPIYMYLDYIPQRIYNALGENIKFIFMLRNPIDRAYSHYWRGYNRNYEKETFERAINFEKERIKAGDFANRHFSYINRGFYANQIKRFLKYFSKKNMKFILFEEFINNTFLIIKDIFSFLEIDKDVLINFNVNKNTSKIVKSKMLKNFIGEPLIKKSAKILIPNKKTRRALEQMIKNLYQRSFEKLKLNINTRNKLLNLYRPEIRELENLIDRDLNLWFK